MHPGDFTTCPACLEFIEDYPMYEALRKQMSEALQT
jgi:hypothetical protein